MAANVIGTILITPTLAGAATLGLIVLIRTFLSWSLELEIEGRWPWQSAPPAAAPTPVADAGTRQSHRRPRRPEARAKPARPSSASEPGSGTTAEEMTERMPVASENS